jgi:hypothetical protein
MDVSTPNHTDCSSSPRETIVSVWCRVKDLIATFDSPGTRHYVARCISLVERLVGQTHPPVTAADVVAAIQSELPLPASVEDLPPTGVLGLCINVATVVSHDEEDPVESIIRALSDRGVESSCFPGAADRESSRKKERDQDI